MPKRRSGASPVRRLEDVLDAAFEDPGHRPEFYRLLLESDLYVLGEAVGSGPGRRATGPEGRAVSIVGLKREGRTVVPAFTSLKRLRESETGARSSVQLNGRALLESLARGTAVLLDPGSPHGKELAPEEIAALLDGTLLDLLRTDEPSRFIARNGRAH